MAVIDEAGRVRLRDKAIRTEAQGFAKKLREREQQRFAQWRDASRQRTGDKDLLVYLRMLDDDNSSNRLLENEGGSESASSTASVISGNWVEGRWPGKRALLFQTREDRARIVIDGSYSQVTFAAWVRIAGFQRPFNALFMSERLSEGGVHWQFSQFGDFRFSVQRRAEKRGWNHDRAWNENLLCPADDGIWRHLSTTYDADQKRVIHYLDGQEVGRHILPTNVELSFGAATIGNTANASKQYWGPRQFGGAVDEFAVFSRLLDADEVKQLYEEGRPD